MADDHPVLKSGPYSMELTPRRLRALKDILDHQIDFEDTPVNEPGPSLTFRPSVSGGERLVFPITCRTAIQAARVGDDRPMCTWMRDAGGYSCERCAKWIGPDTARFDTIQAEFGDTPDSDEKS